MGSKRTQDCRQRGVLWSMRSDRSKQDHITDKPFKTIICDICGKEFSIMSIDSKHTICPKCDMPEGNDK